jgi:hypothetical protein
MEKSVPQGLSPDSLIRIYGTAEAVPFQGRTNQDAAPSDSVHGMPVPDRLEAKFTLPIRAPCPSPPPPPRGHLPV